MSAPSGIHDPLTCGLTDRHGRSYCTACQWEDEQRAMAASRPRPAESADLVEAKRIAASIKAHPEVYRETLLSVLEGPLLEMLQVFTSGKGGTA